MLLAAPTRSVASAGLRRCPAPWLLLGLAAGCVWLGTPARCALGGPPPVHKHASKEQIEALEQQWRTAVMNDDVPLMDKLLADDFVGISMSGQVNTKQMQLDRLRSHSLLLTRMDLSDVKVKLVGTVAIVTSLAQIEGSNDGQQMRGTFRYTRVYQRLPNGMWKVTNFEATRVPIPGERMGRPRSQAQSAPAVPPSRP